MEAELSTLHIATVEAGWLFEPSMGLPVVEQLVSAILINYDNQNSHYQSEQL